VRPAAARVPASSASTVAAVDGHADELRDGMRRTLERIKATAENGG
jgi:hypothetical protein